MDENIKKYFSTGHVSSFYKTNKNQNLKDKINSCAPAYLFVGLPTNYKFKDRTTYSSIALFKIISYTPADYSGGLVFKVKDKAPSLQLETLDGRKIEGYSMENSQVFLSDDVLKELEKNFVHPRLNLENFHGFAYYDMWSDKYDRSTYTVIDIMKKTDAAELYGRWKESRDALAFDIGQRFTNTDKRDAEIREKAEKVKSEKQRYVNEFEKDFASQKDNKADVNGGYSIHICPSCKTKCRIPVRGKKTEVSCPSCKTKFIVFS